MASSPHDNNFRTWFQAIAVTSLLAIQGCASVVTGEPDSDFSAKLKGTALEPPDAMLNVSNTVVVVHDEMSLREFNQKSRHYMNAAQAPLGLIPIVGGLLVDTNHCTRAFTHQNGWREEFGNQNMRVVCVQQRRYGGATALKVFTAGRDFMVPYFRLIAVPDHMPKLSKGDFVELRGGPRWYLHAKDHATEYNADYVTRIICKKDSDFDKCATRAAEDKENFTWRALGDTFRDYPLGKELGFTFNIRYDYPKDPDAKGPFPTTGGTIKTWEEMTLAEKECALNALCKTDKKLKPSGRGPNKGVIPGVTEGAPPELGGYKRYQEFGVKPLPVAKVKGGKPEPEAEPAATTDGADQLVRAEPVDVTKLTERPVDGPLLLEPVPGGADLATTEPVK